MLQQSSRCAVCGESFLNTWLECVKFLDAKKVRLLFVFIFVCILLGFEYPGVISFQLLRMYILQSYSQYNIIIFYLGDVTT